MKIQLNGIEKVNVTNSELRAFVLNPDQVGRCMPDLQELQVIDALHLVAFVKIGLGPIRGKFKMEAELIPTAGVDEASMKVKGSGMGNGLAMTSQMRFVATGAESSELHWSADASVSGPLAGLGGRLIEGQAKKVTEQMFTNIRKALELGGRAVTLGGQ